MFKTLNEMYDEFVRQQKLNELYGALLTASYDLGIDLSELLKELHELDKKLKIEEQKDTK